jgi:hypothetical protein
MSLVLVCIVLLAAGCEGGTTSSANGASSSGSQSTPQLEGVWIGTLTDTKMHIEFAKINLRLTQDSSNQLSGMVRMYDDVWGDKVGCFQLIGMAQPQATFHLDGQDVVSKGDAYFVQFDGSNAPPGYALSGTYGLGRSAIAYLSGTIVRSTGDSGSSSCPSSDSTTPTA